MHRLPPRSQLTATPFPSTTLFRSIGALARDGEIARQREAAPDPRRGTVDRDDDGNVEIGEREQHRVVMTAQRVAAPRPAADRTTRSEEHTSELQSLMRISYAVFCLKKKQKQTQTLERA